MNTKRHASGAPALLAQPQVVVCAGGGGVGKTTTSAALALALARTGRSTLVVTIDPARRLASAMGVPIGAEATKVDLPGTEGRLFALMPDPRESLRTFVDELFVAEPEAKANLLKNRLYIGLSDAAAGIHELVAMNLVASAAARGQFEVVVIDTAPSRHAIDFVTYPARLAALLGGRTMGWLSGIAERAVRRPGSESRGVMGWGAGRLEALLARVTGPNLVNDTASLFGDLLRVRERFVALTEHAADLLLGDQTAYVLVVAPTAAARDDAVYLQRRLAALGRKPRTLVMNRADTGGANFLDVLSGARDLPGSLRETMAVLLGERSARREAADRFSAEIAKAIPRLPIIRLPLIEAVVPDEVMSKLSIEIEPHLDTLLPPPAG